MTHQLRTDKPNRRRAVAGALAGGLAVLMLSTAPAGAQPTSNPSSTEINAPPQFVISQIVSSLFNNAGTNPRFTMAAVSTSAYYSDNRFSLDGRIFYVTVKTNAELREVFPPPPNPFTVTVELSMTNDEGQTASHTLSYKTQWDNRTPSGYPTLKRSSALAPPDVEATAFAEYFFSNTGTNPKLSNVAFSTMDYYQDSSGLDSGILFVKAKSEEDLNALDSPPDSPFSVAVTLQMTNDEGQTATGTVDYITNHTRDEDE